MRVFIAASGWSGCGEAIQAAKMGAETVLMERTDMLLGTGLVVIYMPMAHLKSLRMRLNPAMDSFAASSGASPLSLVTQ